MKITISEGQSLTDEFGDPYEVVKVTDNGVVLKGPTGALQMDFEDLGEELEAGSLTFSDTYDDEEE